MANHKYSQLLTNAGTGLTIETKVQRTIETIYLNTLEPMKFSQATVAVSPLKDFWPLPNAS